MIVRVGGVGSTTLPEDQAVLCDESGDAGRIGLQAVARPHLGEHLRRRRAGREELDQLPEVPLETGRRDDLKQAGIRVARVPEGVPLAERWASSTRHLPVTVSARAGLRIRPAGLRSAGFRSGKFRPMDLTIKDGSNRSISGPKPAQSKPFVAPRGNPGLYLTDA